MVRHLLATALLTVWATAARAGPAAAVGPSDVPGVPEVLQPYAASAGNRPDSCRPLMWSLLWPGAGQLCDGKTAEGVALAGLAALESGLAVAAYLTEGRRSGEGFEHPAVLLPLVGLQDLWVYGMADSYLERQRAAGLPLVPQESLWDLALAPFDVDVVSRPSVWAGTLGLVAAALLFGQVTDSSFDLRRGTLRPEVLRRQYNGGTGYPLAAGIGTAVFSHVAVAEETVFRGVVQSSLARDHGGWGGWALGSLIFGLTHLSNLLIVEPEERLHYGTVDVPFITAVGSYLGLSYIWEGYSLAAPVAIHFWYDLMISLAFLAFDRDGSLFQVGFGLPW